MKIIKFRSPEIAEKVQSHLHDVTTNGDILFFSKFGEVAFNLVLNLENLSRADCLVVDAEQERDRPWFSRPFPD